MMLYLFGVIVWFPYLGLAPVPTDEHPIRGSPRNRPPLYRWTHRAATAGLWTLWRVA